MVRKYPLQGFDKHQDDRRELEQAFVGDAPALESLVARLTPVISRRVIRALVRLGREDLARQRDMTRDLTQDVFLDLFDSDAKILRTWEPGRGLSLENFVGMVAERRTLGRLSRAQYGDSPLDGTEEKPDAPAVNADPEEEVMARDIWRVLLGRLEQSLSPLGWQLFHLLFVEERSQEEIEAETGLSRDAIYAWRSRLRKRVRAIHREAQSDMASDSPVTLTLRQFGVNGG